MSKQKGLVELLAGRCFQREVIILWVRWYLPLRAQLPRLGGDDGRMRRFDHGLHYHVPGMVLCARVQAALEPFRTRGWVFTARR
jgi:hypothetical protein